MNIETLYLKNFRNYDEEKVELCPDINIFFGENAQGKTNILESIYLASMGKSYRTQKYNEMIKWDKDQCKVFLEFDKEEIKGSIEFYIKRNQKKQIKINDIRVEKISDILGKINTVIFSPDHLRIIKEGPSERRKFIDAILSQTKPKYYYNLIQYLKVLEQRNSLLSDDKRKVEAEKTLDIWDSQLVEYGSKVIKERYEFIKTIGEDVKKINNRISGNKEELLLEYRPSVYIKESDLESIKVSYGKAIHEGRLKDIKRGNTNFGPHRDELALSIKEKELRNFGSQGQQRSALLSLKLAETIFIKEETGTTPVLLLDDVFSELDKNRQDYLLGYMKDIQVILTCTDFKKIDFLDSDNYSYFKVKSGSVNKINNKALSNQM